MSRNQRLGMVAIAVVIAVVAVVLLTARSDDESSTSTQSRQTAPATTGTTTTPTTETAPKKPSTPKPPLITAADPQELKFKKGDDVVFRVRNPEAEQVHVHGYDITTKLQPSKTATVSFKADIEGIFEIELEQSGTPLATLTVEP